jgi:hypothetical protein
MESGSVNRMTENAEALKSDVTPAGRHFCGAHVSEATYYTWKKKYADLGVTELRRLKMLEDENSRLKRIVADLTLDKQILQEVVRKKL